MARKKSETAQGDSQSPRIDEETNAATPEPGSPETGPEGTDAPTPAVSEDGEVPPPPPTRDPEFPEDVEPVAHHAPAGEPWDPEITRPEESAESPVESDGVGPETERPETEYPPADTVEPGLGVPQTDAGTAEAAPEYAAARDESTVEPVASTSEPESRYGEPDTEAEHEADHEEEAGTSFAARALTVLLLLLVGAGLGIWAAPRIAPMLPSGLSPVAEWLTPGRSDAEAEIAALQQRVDSGLGDVESRLGALPAPSDIDAKITAAVDDASTKLSSEIEAVKNAAGSTDLSGIEQRLSQLETSVQGQAAELSALKDQLAGATGQVSDDAIQRLDVYKAEVEGLRAEMGSVRDSVSGLSSRLEQAEGRADRQVQEAQAKVAEVQQKADTDLSTAAIAADVAQIRAAIASGAPFDGPVNDLTSRSSVSVPEGLTAAAGSGVETLAALRDSFPDAAHEAIRASIMASAGDGVVARSKAFLEAQMSSRSLTPQEGQGTDAVLSRMEAKLRADDLDGLLTEAEALPSEAAAAMATWLDAAKTRASAVDGLATLQSAAETTTN
jgi:hypothetical protein